MVNKSLQSIQIIAQTMTELSEASSNLGLSVRNLTQDSTRVDNIKVDTEYIQWLSRFINERAKCVLDNTCGRDGLNQWAEDELSAKLSYDFFIEQNNTRKHIQKIAAAVHQAEANGQDGVEWLQKNTNIGDVITGKVKKPWKPEPSSIGKILKEWRGDRYSLYAIAKECGCRSEGLQRIEEGKDVTTTNLMHYLHFIKTHEPQSEVIAAIWQAL